MLKRIKHLLKQNTGMALLLVLCLFALLMGLGASVFFASVTNVKSIDREMASEQAYLSAASVCEVLKDQITKEPPAVGGPSGFKERIDVLLSASSGASEAESSISFNSTLPGSQMGTVEGTFKREDDDYGVLSVTATVREDTYTLQLVFTRLEDASAVEWRFSGYRPL